jgi:hypothetical protein
MHFKLKNPQPTLGESIGMAAFFDERVSRLSAKKISSPDGIHPILDLELTCM